jgi:hypothetical protein
VQDSSGTGDLKLRNLAPGASSKPLRLVADIVQPGGGAQVTLRFKSANDSSRTDSVRVVALG